MRIKYKCSFCNELYDWYDGLYENAEYSFADERKAERQGAEYTVEKGVFISVNGFVLKRANPIDTNAEIQEADGNLQGLFINLCPDCMRKLLDKIKPESEFDSVWDYV